MLLICPKTPSAAATLPNLYSHIVLSTLAHPRHVFPCCGDLADVPVGDLGLKKLGNGEGERKEKDGQDVFEEAASHCVPVVHGLE